MRIWSLHPKYIDAKGIVALWREALLAKKVLEGKTKGYKHHPQLIRFKLTENPLNNINFYLSLVYKEAQDRGYNFNKNKIDWKFKSAKLKVTEGQIKYEVVQLKKKLKIRNKNKYREMTVVNRFSPHPLFKIVKGEIEGWEKVKY